MPDPRAEVVAKIHYEMCEWSGCAGSVWGRIPEGDRRRMIREADRWIACMRLAEES